MLDVGSYDPQTWLTALTLVATVGGWLFDRYVVRRRRLSYRVHWNRPVDVTPAAAHDMDLSIVRNGRMVPSPSLVVLRVENVGSFDVGADDLGESLQCSFGGRRIVHFEVQDTDPPELADAILRPRSGERPELLPYHADEADAAESGVLRLPRFGMRRGSRFKLLVLLSGDGRDVHLTGDLSGGDIVKEQRGGPRSRSGLVLGGLSLALGGLLIGLVVTAGPADPPEHLACPQAGALSVSGSTALALAVQELATRYAHACPGVVVQVNPIGTDTAVQQLLAGGEADAQTHSSEAARIKLAMADDYPGRPVRDPRLGSWPLGIGLFAVVVHKDSGISRLSGAQLQALYDGRRPQWNDDDLDGAARPVVLVSRAPGSGTRDAFVHRVLGREGQAAVSSSDCLSRDVPGHQADVMHCEVTSTRDMLDRVARTPGAIGYAGAADAAAVHDGTLRIVPVDGYLPTVDAVASGRYRFWAVERLYRYGPQLPPTVRDHFVQFATTQSSALAVLAAHGFHRCDDPAFLAGEVAAACQQLNGTPAPSASGGAVPDGPLAPALTPTASRTTGSGRPGSGSPG